MRHITSQMENMNMQSEQSSLVGELAQGRELARQLEIHLNAPSSSHGTREILVQKIIVSYEKALAMLSSSSSVLAGEQQLPAGVARMIESPPHSLNGSPRSEDSDREFKDQDHKDPSRKRKIMPRWTQQIRVTSGMGLEGRLDDGFSWRKYGQKDILGAKYPRGYYRCTHRNAQGCLATKQVQRSDQDLSIFEITYRGRHTCSQASPTSSALPDQRPEAPNKSAVDTRQNQQRSQRDTLLSLPEGLRVITEGLDSREDLSNSMMNNNIGGSFSPPSFMAPETSGTDYFSVALSQQGIGGNNNFHQNAEIIPAATSATNSPTVGLNFPFGQPGQLYPHFTFGEPGFFS